MSQEKKAPPDWERIEADYRAGVLSLREIAASQGVTEGAIRKRAKRDDWARDLAGKVRAKADELVRRELVRSAVRTGSDAYSEKEIVAANGEAVAAIEIGQRKDIGRARTLAMSLLAELEHETDNFELFEELGEILRSEDDRGQDKRNDIYQKVISSAGRIDSMKKLADTLKTLVGLQREAYGLVAAQKLEVTGKNGGPIETRTAQEMTDDELAAYIGASGARTMDSPQS
ncbi:hypothetical protein [Burkholderia sp. BCC0405]|uniref:hypothetical protein n=1 Tax=Burkholderia sp. BCC0405 TaxID=2676298 RepID=UPI00158B4E97|nr:hypothetical protein [Burkholderia sp. BCC0405]